MEPSPTIRERVGELMLLFFTGESSLIQVHRRQLLFWNKGVVDGFGVFASAAWVRVTAPLLSSADEYGSRIRLACFTKR
jgi:hypothetical protein